MSKYLLMCITSLVLFVAPGVARAEHAMVLVAHKDSAIQSISPLDLRKLYLGFTVVGDNGEVLRPMTNSSDARLWEVFLQNVMGMSARSYNHRLLTLTLQSGRRRPASYDDLDQLLDVVRDNKQAVSFIWEEDLRDRTDFKVVKLLWRR